MTFTSSIVYIAVAGGLLYLACSKPSKFDTSSIPLPAPVVKAVDHPSLIILHEKGIAAAQSNSNYVPVDARDMPASYTPIDHSKLNL